MAHAAIHRAGGAVEEIPSKRVTTLCRGDRVVIETAGGGGYGDPGKRERARVEADLADGKVTAHAAE
jgi:N-methylhydantoinase B/oxoprolinase/acetone carboxylase alpha subunit